MPDSPLVARLRAAGCVFAEDEAALLVATASSPDVLTAMADRRVAGSPLEHVLGWAEFCGLRLALDEGVFVPRHRSELLVTRAADLVGPDAVVVDLCCGVGAIGAAVTARAGPLELHAVDVDPAAVACARRNLPGAEVHEGDLYDPLPERLLGRVDLVVASTPYVPTDAIALMPPEAREHETRLALDGGGDGLDLVRRVAAGASRWLAHGGHLVTETGEHQGDTAASILRAVGLTSDVVHDDDGDATVIIGRA